MTPDAARARDEARDILADGRFQETELPRPLRGPLAWIGEQLEPVLDALGDLLPGGRRVEWIVLAAIVLLAALLVALYLIRARAPSGVLPGRRRNSEALLDPAELERLADRAELDGELERALRLRFRAGVLRLAALRVVEDPGSVTTGALVRRLRSEPFSNAARSFDEVVYGRRRPTADDVRLAREGWRAALAGSGR